MTSWTRLFPEYIYIYIVSIRSIEVFPPLGVVTQLGSMNKIRKTTQWNNTQTDRFMIMYDFVC